MSMVVPAGLREQNPRPEGVSQPKNCDFLVVGLGASAGGLEAVRKLLAALPADTGIAFVLIQHLDPDHKSMLVELLTRDTAMKVIQAADGIAIERNCLYVIPPHAYLSVHSGSFSLSEPRARHGAAHAVRFFLQSLAREYGERAACVVLSGTGADGSIGLKAIREKGGLVIAQDPEEAAYGGMPRSAIATLAVDLVLSAAEIPAALIRFAHHPLITAKSPYFTRRGAYKIALYPHRSSALKSLRMIFPTTRRRHCSAASGDGWRLRDPGDRGLHQGSA